MNHSVHMQDQVKNRISLIMQDEKSWSLDDLAQTAISVVLVMAFLTIGIVW